MPAGLLPVIATGMGTSEGTVGLFVSAYALGTVIITIPAITMTRGLRRNSHRREHRATGLPPRPAPSKTAETQEELIEAITHVTIYAGWPKGMARWA